MSQSEYCLTALENIGVDIIITHIYGKNDDCGNETCPKCAEEVEEISE
jgi:hypothetical protein